MAHAKKSDKGFTLVELLVVIVILGILLTLAISSYVSTVNSAKKNTFCINVRMVISTIESLHASNLELGYPASYEQLNQIMTSTAYFSQLPKNPYTGTVLHATGTV